VCSLCFLSDGHTCGGAFARWIILLYMLMSLVLCRRHLYGGSMSSLCFLSDGHTCGGAFARWIILLYMLMSLVLRGFVRGGCLRSVCNRLDKRCFRKNMGCVVRLGDIFGLHGQMNMLLFGVRNICNKLGVRCCRENMRCVVRLGDVFSLYGQMNMLLFRVFSPSLFTLFLSWLPLHALFVFIRWIKNRWGCDRYVKRP